MDWETWGLPLMILSVGLSAGIFLATRTTTADTAARPKEDHSARKEALLEQIRELDADRDKMEPGEYTTRREQLIAEAAEAQRGLTELAAPAAVPAPAAGGAARVGLWAGLTLVFFVILGVLINEYSRPRADGETMTGGTMSEINDARQARLDAAKGVLRSDPENLNAINTLAYDALLYRDLDTAMAQLDRARELAPSDPDVMVNLAILQMSVGMADRAEMALSSVLAKDPGHGRALLWTGFYQANTGAKEAAIATLTRAVSAVQWPEEQLFAENMLKELTAPPPTVYIAGSAAMAEGAPIPQGTLYVYARRSEAGGGPPVAAARSQAALPADFQLTSADMIMGGNWPEQVWVQARIDADGDPMTRDDTLAESAVIGPLSSGAEAVSLTLTPTGTAAAPIDAAPDEAPAASSGPRIAGTIPLPASVSDGAVVFVIVRRAEGGGGPPVAAKKLTPSGDSLSFAITDADMMLGGAWPDEVWVSARLDTDGNAMTRSEGDVESLVVGPLASGAAAVTLSLADQPTIAE